MIFSVVAIVTGTSREGQYLGRALAIAGSGSRLDKPRPGYHSNNSSRRSRRCYWRCRWRWTCGVMMASAKMVQSAVEHFGKIDILVNNAGCNVRKPALDVSWDDWNLILDTNLRGTFFVSQAVARHMIPKKYGRIINIGSVTCVAGYAGLGPYGASRGGVKQLTMSLADDWGVHGITVNCLAPGWFKTAQNAVMYENKEWVEYLCDRIPLKRPGQPADLDGAVVFLASDASAYITAQTLLVDGGISGGATRALPKPKS